MTKNPTPNVMTVSTGITPQTKTIKELNGFSKKLHDMSSKADNIYVGLKKFVTYVIE